MYMRAMRSTGTGPNKPCEQVQSARSAESGVRVRTVYGAVGSIRGLYYDVQNTPFARAKPLRKI